MPLAGPSVTIESRISVRSWPSLLKAHGRAQKLIKFMSVLSILKGRRATRWTVSKKGSWPLDLPLVRFSKRPEDVWTLGDAIQGVAIFGENGSGKTSGSGSILARRYLANGFGGLVLCFKTDEAELWRSYLEAAGHEKDGCFFSVDENYRFNFLDYEAETSGIDLWRTWSRCWSILPQSRNAQRPISGCRKRRSCCVTRSRCFLWLRSHFS